jgi:hypothetical protein
MELSLYALHDAIHFRLSKKSWPSPGKRDGAQAMRDRIDNNQANLMGGTARWAG